MKRIEDRILDIILRRRKLIPEEQLDLIPVLHPQHWLRIEALVRKNAPILMVLPAFPGKSPNRGKTLSRYPDLAEKYALDQLSVLCQQIQEIYPPGAKICICSDGLVFSDLVRIPDEEVMFYVAEVQKYYRQHHLAYFSFCDLKDAYPELPCLDSMREELMINHGESLIALKQKVTTEYATLSMYRGITRFLFEDFTGLKEFANWSNTQIQKAAKQTALRVMQRSNAWSNYLERAMPEAIRLSIHPQPFASEKIGIHMGDEQCSWRTPWHSVAIKQDGGVKFLKRNLIDEKKHRLVFSEGRPCHYLLEKDLTAEGISGV